MKRLLLGIMIGLVASGLWGLAKGEDLFQRGQVEEAKNHYRTLLAKDPNSPTLHYNLGNVYWKMGELGEALTHYYKAEVWRPLDSDLRQNIRLLESKVVNRETPPLTLHKILSHLSPAAWLFFTLFFLALALASWIRFPTHKQRRLCMGLSAMSLFLMGLSSVYFFQREFHKYGVIIAPKVAVYSGPSQSLEIMFFIHEGIRIETHKQVNGWVQISLENKLEGWIKDESYWEL